jgi:transposase InsO family protein
MLDRPDPPNSDPIGEGPGGRPRDYPSLDDVAADDLRADDIVFIDNVPLRFLSKRKGSPYIFWDGRANQAVEKTTTELLMLMEAGRYYRPGGRKPASGDSEKGADYLMRRRVAFNAHSKNARQRASAKWLYVQEFVTRINNAAAEGSMYFRNHDNAQDVICHIDAWIDNLNNRETNRAKWIIKPHNRAPRSLLRWVQKELDHPLQEAGLLHLNAVKGRPRSLPDAVYDIIALTIREMVEVSSKLGPTKIRIRVKKKIDEYNAENGTDLPKPSLSIVQNEYRRYDAWVRMVADQGKAKADLEYGAIGKLVRPERILDLVELDHHKFDFHAIFGETPFTKAMSDAGMDRFWVCLALDVHSGYPLGFSISYEPGGLLPALSCIDHSIKSKPYVRLRYPQIHGDLLGFGKPVRFRYDNAKEFVSLQIQAALARIGVGFQMAVPKKPETKPYVERFFGTLEEDFIHWLKGSTGSNPREKNHRNPLKEARLSVEDFVELFHQWLIEVYARRKQRDMNWDTPEERWMRGVNSDSHRPRPLTEEERSRWDLVASVEVDVSATNEGFLWKNLDYQSEDLQKIRRKAGEHGQRVMVPTSLRARIPLKDISKAYVAVPKFLIERFPDEFPTPEVIVPCLNPHVAGRGLWQHGVVCDFLRQHRKNPANHADYEEGFLRLFESAMAKMKVRPANAAPLKRKGPHKLTGGQAPRFAGVLHAGTEHHALQQTDDLIRRFDVFGEIAAAKKAKDAEDAKAARAKAPPPDEATTNHWTVDHDPLDEPEEQSE